MASVQIDSELRENFFHCRIILANEKGILLSEEDWEQPFTEKQV